MKDILKSLTYGHYIVTALKPGDELKTQNRDYLAAGTVNWISQLSFEPAMIGVAIGLKAELNETIDYSQHFTVHLLKEGQEDWIEKFAHNSEIADGKINGVPFTKKDHALILKGTLGYITCKVEKAINNGDHTFHIGTVIDTHLEDTDSQPICTKETTPNYTLKDAAV